MYPTKLEPITEGGYIYHQIINLIGDKPLLLSIISILFIFFEAVLINRIVIKNRLSINITLLPGMFYIILVSLSPEMHIFSPFIFSIFFVLLAISNLFKTYKKYNSERFLFNTGLYIGFSILFYDNLILVIIPFLLGMLSIRTFKIRELFQFISGLVPIAYFYAFWAFWTGSPIAIPTINYYSLTLLFNGDIFRYIIIGIYLFLIVNSILTYRSFVIKKSIQSQKKINIIFWLSIFSIAMTVFINPDYFVSSLIFIATPLSFFTALIFLRIKNNLIAEIVNLIIVFSILIYHFQIYS